MKYLENCQSRYPSNPSMGRTRTDGPDEFEPSKFDCSCFRICISEFHDSMIILELSPLDVSGKNRHKLLKVWWKGTFTNLFNPHPANNYFGLENVCFLHLLHIYIQMHFLLLLIMEAKHMDPDQTAP